MLLSNMITELLGESNQLLTTAQVANNLGISRSYMYNLESKDKDFPKSLKIRGRKYWRLDEVEQYKTKKKQEILEQIANLNIN